MSLVDPEDDGPRRDRGRGGVPTLNVKCWRSSWAPLRHGLAKQGIELAEGMVVVLRGVARPLPGQGRDQPHPRRGGRDRVARAPRRAAGAAAAHARGRGPAAPQRGAAHARGAAARRPGRQPGHGGLPGLPRPADGSGFGFRISHVPVSVQGPGAPASIARALTVLSRSDCDVIAVVRGGGARADLAAFETEVVARAVAAAAKPVFTGSGTRGTRPWPTSSRPGLHHADRVRAADRVGDAALVGGRTWPSRPGSWRRARPSCATPRPATARPAAASPRAARQQLRVHRERLTTKGSCHRPGGTRPARAVSARVARPRRPARAAQSGPPRAPGRARAVVAPAAGRLRRGPAARAGLQPDPDAWTVAWCAARAAWPSSRRS